MSDYTLLQREPVAAPQFIKEGVVLLVSGLTLFTPVTLSAEQQAWVLAVAAFVGILTSVYGRQHAWPDERIQNEFLDAEQALQPRGDAHMERVGEYGTVPIVPEDG